MDRADDNFALFLARLLRPEEEVVGFGDKGTPVPEPTRVYRVELPDGRGPFNSQWVDNSKIFRFYEGKGIGDRGEQMGVTERAFDEAHGDAAYGVADLEAARHWFPEPAREVISENEGYLWEFEIPKGGYIMRLAQGEVVFSRKEARRIRKLDLVDDL